jgi:hypothetical protein
LILIRFVFFKGSSVKSIFREQPGVAGVAGVADAVRVVLRKPNVRSATSAKFTTSRHVSAGWSQSASTRHGSQICPAVQKPTGPQTPAAVQAGSVVRGTRSRPGAAHVVSPSPGPIPGAPAKMFERGGISMKSPMLQPASFSTRSQNPSASVSASTRRPWHMPFEHWSVWVQVLPSSQAKPLRPTGSKMHPPIGSQVSRVQTLPSSHV